MVFSSPTFVCVFLPMVVALYFSLPRPWRNTVLIIASFVFYGWGDPVALLLIGPSIGINFLAGRLIGAASGTRRRAMVSGAIAFNLFILAVFKYTGFLVQTLNEVLGLTGERQIGDPIHSLPLGISFFTFHIISYLVDVYRGTVPVQQALAPFALYIVNFPQLIAGPIIRYRQIADQLVDRIITFDDIDAGVTRFVTGLAKKVLIANPVGAVADWAFATPADDLTAASAWVAVVCYALQIYFDFSGYSDMAIGLARIFGFRFPENFNYPYAATSIQDFWRRWHMTLSAWFRDYVYIPLGGNRFGPLKTTRNLWLVFLLTGLWHGAGWNFVVWGAWHGFFLWIERVGPVAGLLARVPFAVRNTYTLFVVLLGWVFFRSPTLGYALTYLSHMLWLKGDAPQAWHISTLLSAPMAIFIAASAVLAYPLWPAIKHRLALVRKAPDADPLADLARAAFVATAMVLSIALMAVGGQNPFLYFRF